MTLASLPAMPYTGPTSQPEVIMMHQPLTIVAERSFVTDATIINPDPKMVNERFLTIIGKIEMNKIAEFGSAALSDNDKD